MNTYLFVTSPEYEPESVGASEESRWSCSKTTRAEDHALVYVTGEGISFEWRVTSDAETGTEWSYECDVEHVDDFDPPITIQELRDAITPEEWKPPHLNFRGYKSIVIPRDVFDKIRALRQRAIPSLEDVENDFLRKVAESLDLAASQRRARLATAKKRPAKIEVVTKIFVRNPDVAAEVLTRAIGRCESCGCAASFTRASNGSPYLEIHHRVRLADGGEDTVENATALCPNCHRKAHFG